VSAEQLVLEAVVPEAPLLRPTPEQQGAVDSRERNVLLEAGAGSGKTRVLVERFCDAVEADGTDSALAFTFTERAAGELRGRIRHELAARAADAAGRGEAERADALAGLARESERAWISTIHGFCRRLLASHPVALGLDPRFRVLDEPEASRLAYAAFEDSLEEFLGAGDPERARLVAALRAASLRDIVIGAHDELRSRGVEIAIPEPAEPDVAGAIAALRKAATGACAETEGGRGGPDNHDRLRRAAELGDDATEAEIAGLELRGKARVFSGPSCESYRRAWRAARRALVERASVSAYRQIAELLALFARRYEERKEDRSGLDFEDLQLRARELLHDRPEIAATYRERFRHVLVDEFQDTNALQLELVRQLQGPETQVFCVGDEFQSIYGFRHADVEVFRRERDRLREAEEAAVLPLRGNFRSLAPVVAAIDALAATILPGFEALTVAREDEAPGRRDEPEVDLLLTPGGKAWKDEALGLELPGDYPSGPDRVAEARLLAERLRELVESGRPRKDIVVLLRAFTHVGALEEALERAGLRPYVVGGRGYWSQQQVDDVRRMLAVIANPLDDEALLGVLASPACAVLPDTLWLLRRAAGNRMLWPLVERQFGDEPTEPPDPEDEEAVERASWLEHIPGDDRERLRALRADLVDLRERAPLLGLDRLIDEAITAFGYDLAVLSMNRGVRRYANVRKLMRLGREYERTEGRDLRGFLRFLDERSAADREGEAATEAEDHDGVRVMTVHAAKGLEFPVVAVADLGRGLLDGGRQPAVTVGETAGSDDDELPALRVGIRMARFGSPAVGIFGYDELIERAADDAAAEACRLAYVAMTRARDHLILSGIYSATNLAKPPEEGVRAGTPITERLMRALEIEEGEDSTLDVPAAEPRPGLELRCPPGRIRVRFNRPEPEAFAALRAATAPADERAQRPLLEPPLARPETQTEPAARHLSYSALATYGRCAYRFFAERIARLDPIEQAATGDDGEGGAGRFGFGNAVHALLEWSARRDWRVPGADLAGALLRREGLDADAAQVERALARVTGWLDSDLRQRLNGERARPEVPFILPLGGSIVRGNIDLLATDDGIPLVVDYKTDALGELSPAELVDRYGVQRQIYALAAGGGAAEIVRTAYVFLERPDEPVELELDSPALAAARGELETMIASIRAGDFEVTPNPHRALCWDCPARARLCSHDKDATGRRLPQP
jgi:ATP-dependent helicase/nuclease subunit A